MALLKSLFHVLATIVFVFLVSACALQCPDSYPIKSCPQPYEPINNRECCYTREKGYHCCAGGLPPWAIILVVILVLGVVATAIGLGALWYFGYLNRCCCVEKCKRDVRDSPQTQRQGQRKRQSGRQERYQPESREYEGQVEIQSNI
ncbi:uncharacterized protein [Ptychodera flava]|uniref:uncharacterized protein isoform X2 n=1 Tax=Ptychodera flava TaxID=63121 RepID=UPI00396A679A